MAAKILGLSLAVAVVLSFGCGKKKEQGPAPQGQPTANERLETSAGGAAQAVEGAKEDVKAATGEATKQAEAVTNKAEGELKAAQTTFDALVADAKALIDGKKYQDALTKLQAGLATPNLTGEQKSTLQKLIDQAKAALAGNVTQDAQKAAGDLLKGLGGKK